MPHSSLLARIQHIAGGAGFTDFAVALFDYDTALAFSQLFSPGTAAWLMAGNVALLIIDMQRDFLDPAGYEPGLTALVGRGFQVDLVQILAPDELSPTAFGDLRLVDSESGATQEVTFGRFRLKAYRQTLQNFMQRLREFCQARGINFFTASSNTDLQELLLKQLRQAEVWG